MNVLTDKSKRDYNYTSRYRSFNYYYNTEDKKYVYEIMSKLRKDCEYVIHDVTDIDTLDSLALKYYGDPSAYWIIADFNDINDPFINLFEQFNFLYIPSISGIRWE